jgi:hypothetical protein
VNISFLVFIASILGFYGIVVLLRRARLRKTATALDATYTPGSWGRAATIAGRHFTIEISRVGKSFSTTVEVRTGKTPCSGLFYSRFFEYYPDWEHARVLKTQEERLFVAQVSVPRYIRPTEEEREALWRWLIRSSIDRRLPYDLLKQARIREILVGDEAVSTSFGGVVANVTQLRRTLAALERLASDERADSGAATRVMVE